MRARRDRWRRLVVALGLSTVVLSGCVSTGQVAGLGMGLVGGAAIIGGTGYRPPKRCTLDHPCYDGALPITTGEVQTKFATSVPLIIAGSALVAGGIALIVAFRDDDRQTFTKNAAAPR